MKFIEDTPLRAYIDLSAFRSNIDFIKKKYPQAPIILPVKANAYGHGDVIISREAEKSGVNYLGIARVIEGIKLRENNIKLPIINLGVEFGKNIEHAIDYNIDLSVSSIEHIKEIESTAKNKNTKALIHLKADTGMGRLGCDYKDIEKLSKFIVKSKYLIYKSLYSHFSRSDDDSNTTDHQIKLFNEIKNKLIKKNISPGFYHLYNSGAVLKSLKNDENFGIRPGIMCYGYSPSEKYNDLLKPVMTLKSKIIHIKKVPKNTGISYGHTYITNKPVIIGTIPLGYGDGFSRNHSNKFQVTIKNKNYNQIGTITMDLSVLEIDKLVKLNDDVIIFGNKKNCINDANDLAKNISTISYEITTSLTERVLRIPINF